MLQTLHWEPKDTSEELHSILETLGKNYPLNSTDSTDAIRLAFDKQNGSKALVIRKTNDVAEIHYSAPNHAARAIGALLAGLPESGDELSEEDNFDVLGIMLDCSRNAVMSVQHFKKWLRNLALLGFNTAMLYTEDTYV
ncbi:MAG: hypothetical protein ACOC6C_06255, partial [Verrucomicrobiota bacterium]